MMMMMMMMIFLLLLFVFSLPLLSFFFLVAELPVSGFAASAVCM